MLYVQYENPETSWNASYVALTIRSNLMVTMVILQAVLQQIADQFHLEFSNTHYKITNTYAGLFKYFYTHYQIQK